MKTPPPETWTITDEDVAQIASDIVRTQTPVANAASLDPFVSQRVREMFVKLSGLTRSTLPVPDQPGMSEVIYRTGDQRRRTTDVPPAKPAAPSAPPQPAASAPASKTAPEPPDLGTIELPERYPPSPPATLNTPPQIRGSRLMNLHEAARELIDVVDLEAAKERAVRDHFKWGLIDAFKREGIVKDWKEYAELLGSVWLSAEGAAKLKWEKMAGRAYMPVFSPGCIDYRTAFEVLILEAGIPYKETVTLKNLLACFARMEPLRIPGLQDLHLRDATVQRSAWHEAACALPTLEPAAPSLSFTPNQPQGTVSDKSPTELAEDEAAGRAAYIDPVTDLIRFRMQVDQGLRAVLGERNINFNQLLPLDYRRHLRACFANASIDKYLPDKIGPGVKSGESSVMMYPLYCTPVGQGDVGILIFYWDAANGCVTVGYCFPETKAPHFRTREVIS